MSYINFESGGTLQFRRTDQLLESSSHYNTIELSPQNKFVEQSGEGPSETANEEVLRDAKNRRIIRKTSLYDSELIVKQNMKKNGLLIDPSLEYKEKTGHITGTSQWQQKPTTKLQKKIDKAVSKPLKIDKAASMMAKMGWQGGALGKSGTGIMEPIIPNAIYATKTSGFGQPEPADENPSTKSFRKKNKPQNVRILKKQQKKLDRCLFRSNVLTHILEFLQNDFETELMFDSSLDNRERKQIHELMQKLNDKTLLKASAGSGDLHELLVEIHRYQYVLNTQSEGELNQRTLCVYKDAPPYMFLVTHHDLRNEPQEIIEDETYLDRNMEDDSVIVETATRESPILIDDDDEMNDLIERDGEEENSDTDDKDMILEKSEEDAKQFDNCVVVEDLKFAPNALETVDVAKIPDNNVASETLKPAAGLENDKTKKSNLILNVTNAIKAKPIKKPILSYKAQRKLERHNKYKAKQLEKKIERQQSKRKGLADVLKKNTVISKQKISYNISTREEISNLILEYFNAFVKDSNYSEFKFLGAFEDLEVELINEFISDVWRIVKDDDYVSDAVYTVISGANCSVAIKEDSNGSAVIYKMTEESEVGAKT